MDGDNLYFVGEATVDDPVVIKPDLPKLLSCYFFHNTAPFRKLLQGCYPFPKLAGQLLCILNRLLVHIVQDVFDILQC